MSSPNDDASYLIPEADYIVNNSDDIPEIPSTGSEFSALIPSAGTLALDNVRKVRKASVSRDERGALLEDPIDDVEVVDAPKASVGSSIVNLVNSIVGGGVLSLPFAFNLCGVILGSILLVTVALMSFYSAHLLVYATTYAKKVGKMKRNVSYKDIITLSFGQFGAYLTEASIALFLMGACIAYLSIVGSVIEPYIRVWAGAADDNEVLRSWLVQLVLLVLVMYPLAMLRTMNALRYASLLAIGGIVFLVGCVLVRGVGTIGEAVRADEQRFLDELKFARWEHRVFAAIPIISFSFTMHLQLFPISHELERPTPRRIRMVVGGAIAICWLLYLLVGVFGYLSFLDATTDNILTHYDNDVVIEIGKFAYCAVICLSFPLMMFPTRLSVDSIYAFVMRRQQSDRFRRRFMEVTPICLVSFGLSVASRGNISGVFGIVGSTVGVLLVFILPALSTMRLSYRVAVMEGRDLGRRWWLGQIAPMILTFAGVFFSIAGLVSIFMPMPSD